MNLFDKLVAEALINKPELSFLKIVVEKELLHHDILRVLNDHNFLKDLTFIGGTCLRCCYGNERLSEDLDFAGGHEFSRDSLSHMGRVLAQELQNKYELPVIVNEPIKDKQNVDTWKIKIETRPEKRHFPAQRINIDICRVPSYEKRSMMLLNPYGVDMGTSGLIIQVESREEIYVDKLIAVAFRPNRIKYRDLWDISWLHAQGIKPALTLLFNKLNDRNITIDAFLNEFDVRRKLLEEKKPAIITEFKNEMLRFLSEKESRQISAPENFLSFIVYLLEESGKKIRNMISSEK